jgi:hypothetical protein
VATTESVVEVPAVIVADAGCVVIVSAATGFELTTNGAETAEQPLAFVTVTVYEPATETVIDCVVAPVDQRFPVAEEDVRVTVLPAQTNEFPPLIVGVATAGLAVTG